MDKLRKEVLVMLEALEAGEVVAGAAQKDEDERLDALREQFIESGVDSFVALGIPRDDPNLELFQRTGSNDAFDVLLTDVQGLIEERKLW